MIDWNGNGKIDDDDHAITAFVIGQMNREVEREKNNDRFSDDADEGADDYFLDDEE